MRPIQSLYLIQSLRLPLKASESEQNQNSKNYVSTKPSEFAQDQQQLICIGFQMKQIHRFILQ
jgi:hypothetical protein